MKDYITNEKVKVLNERLEDYLNARGYSIDWLNNLIIRTTEINGGINRKSLIAVADVLSKTLEDKFAIKLPYTWGGGKAIESGLYTFKDVNNGFDVSKDNGVNPNYGYTFNDEEKVKYTHPGDGTIYTNYGPDCAGLVISIMKFIGLPDFIKSTANMRDGYNGAKNNELFLPLGDVYGFNKEHLDTLPNKELFESYYSLYNDNVYLGKPGDLLQIPGHVLMIMEVDEVNGVFYTIEAAGSPRFSVNRCKISIEEIKKHGRYCLINIDELLSNPDKMLSKYNLTDYQNDRELNLLETAQLKK